MPFNPVNTGAQLSLLANNTPGPFPKQFIRPIQDAIDFDLAWCWLSICRQRHDGTCGKNSKLNQLKKLQPAQELESFCCIDVEHNCLAKPPVNYPYAALSYI